MILTIKDYLSLLIIFILLVLLAISRFEVNSARNDLSNLKDNLNAQHEFAAKEKIRIDAEHQKEFADAQNGWPDALAVLNDRLRKSEIMSGKCSMPVASSSSSNGSMPRTEENTTGTINPIETSARTGQTFYEAAMRDTLQCSKLIKFVSQ